MTRSVLFSLFMILTLATTVARAEDADPASDRAAVYATTPAKHDGRRWRIGYYEGGQYSDYEVILKAIVRGLIALKWMEPLAIPPDNNPTPGGFWQYLATHAKSDYITFVPDAYYSAGNFDSALRPKSRRTVIQRLNKKADIDLMIAMGTWAGQDLATNEHHVPTIVASTSDPVGSGIVVSATNSGRPHLNAKVEPDRYMRQVEMFHDIIHFGVLGIVYEDTPEGRTFGAVEAIEKAAARRGFRIERCFAKFGDATAEQAQQGVVDCYRSMVGKVDAAYLTVHRGLNEASFPKVIAALTTANIPTFSMSGESEVKRGALMSVAQSNYVYVGQFHAETIARVFNGARPGDLPQIWQAPAKIALNLRAAELIGYDPPVDILMASDEIYQQIEGGKLGGE